MPKPVERFDEFPFQYSGEMMQRALIVDALVTNPTFLIADNVTQQLDVTIAAQILRLMAELKEEFNTSIIFISSSLAMVREIADEIIVLQQGRTIERSTPQRLVDAPVHAYSKNLLDRIPRICTAQEAHDVHDKIQDPQPILSVREVHKTYRVKDPSSFFGHKDVQAVRGVSFDVLAGENFGIVGESGCGKSTLSRLLSWIEAPEQGEIAFHGNDIGRMKSRDILNLCRRFQLLL